MDLRNRYWCGTRRLLVDGTGMMFLLEVFATIIIFLFSAVTVLFVGVMAVVSILIMVVIQALCIVGVIKDVKNKDII